MGRVQHLAEHPLNVFSVDRGQNLEFFFFRDLRQIRVHGVEFGVSCLWFGVPSFSFFLVQGTGLGVQGSGYKVQDVGAAKHH